MLAHFLRNVTWWKWHRDVTFVKVTTITNLVLSLHPKLLANFHQIYSCSFSFVQTLSTHLVGRSHAFTNSCNHALIILQHFLGFNQMRRRLPIDTCVIPCTGRTFSQSESPNGWHLVYACTHTMEVNRIQFEIGDPKLFAEYFFSIRIRRRSHRVECCTIHISKVFLNIFIRSSLCTFQWYKRSSTSYSLRFSELEWYWPFHHFNLKT